MSHTHECRMYTITAARPTDLPLLPAIELAAARLLAGHAPESVLAEVTSQETLTRAQSLGQLWVALAGDAPVGFAHVELFEPRTAHLRELDVHPEHGRRGLGRRLVLAVCEWAATRGFAAVTLTTFRDVPWNMPFYSRLGFEVIPSDSLTPALRAVVESEARRGLDPGRRVVMRADTTMSLARDSDRSRLMEVWESSVRATHHFLGERDLELIVPLARAELARIAPIQCLRDADGVVYAFMSVAGDALEALFVDPPHRGSGAGRRLVEYAIDKLGAKKVDVNEQNALARGFYERLGFRTFDRSASDGQGLPFPILHMKLSSHDATNVGA
jgi:putative acetyltransferase